MSRNATFLALSLVLAGLFSKVELCRGLFSTARATHTSLFLVHGIPMLVGCRALRDRLVPTSFRNSRYTFQPLGLAWLGIVPLGGSPNSRDFIVGPMLSRPSARNRADEVLVQRDRRTLEGRENLARKDFEEQCVRRAASVHLSKSGYNCVYHCSLVLVCWVWVCSQFPSQHSNARLSRSVRPRSPVTGSGLRVMLLGS